jgi:DNA-binding transcriptional MerR regulator
MPEEEYRLTIGALARRADTKVETVRYYERIGLLPAPLRSAGNQRVYGKAAADRLAFIRHARELGFPLDAVRELLQLADQPDRSCAGADQIAARHLQAVRLKIARLRALEAELERMLVACAHERIATCRVIEVLADHSHAHCLDPAHGHGLGQTDAQD